jgi:hypothetical protein
MEKKDITSAFEMVLEEIELVVENLNYEGLSR